MSADLPVATSTTKKRKIDNTESAAHEIVESHKTILDLNDDVILYVMNFLPLKAKLSLARAHSRFVVPFQIYAKIHQKQIDIELLYKITIEDIKFLLEIVGDSVSSVSFERYEGGSFYSEGEENSIIQTIRQHCKNLEFLTLAASPHLYQVESLTNLRGLRLIHCNLEAQFFHTLQKLPKLTHLFLYECDFDTYSAESFSNIELPNLKKLSINHMRPWQVSEALLALCKNIEILDLFENEVNMQTLNELNMLKNLNIYDSAFLTDNFKTSILHQSKQLKSLKIQESSEVISPENFEVISQLRELNRLHLNFIVLNEHNLRALATLENLIELKVTGKHLESDDLFELVKNCRKLRWVNFSCTNVDNEFARKILRLVQAEPRTNGPITFLVYGSEMNKEADFPKEFNTEEWKNLVKFVFDRFVSPADIDYDNFEDDFEKDFCEVAEPSFFKLHE